MFIANMYIKTTLKFTLYFLSLEFHELVVFTETKE